MYLFFLKMFNSETNSKLDEENTFWNRITSKCVLTVLVMVIIFFVIYGILLYAFKLQNTDYFSGAFWNVCHFWLFLVVALTTQLQALDILIIAITWEFIEFTLYKLGWKAFEETFRRKVENLVSDLTGFIAGTELKHYLRKNSV